MGIQLIGSLLFELFPFLKNCVILAKKKKTTTWRVTYMAITA